MRKTGVFIAFLLVFSLFHEVSHASDTIPLSCMNKKAIPSFAWFIPLIPLALAGAIYFGEFQSSSFLFINRFTQFLPDTLWAWLTFLGNGWGVFALAFPLLLLAPRLLTAGIFGVC